MGGLKLLKMGGLHGRPSSRSNMAEDKKLNQLRYYASRRLPIFPVVWIDQGVCSCGNAECKHKGKHPLVSGGFYQASVNADQITAWHEKWPDANWGMRTGSITEGGAGIVVVDIDPRNGGPQTWEHLTYENPDPIETITVQTGGKGWHYWFAHPDGVDIGSHKDALGPGVDIKANKGYVLIPPSKTENPYTFDLNPDDTILERVPSWMLPLLNGRVGQSKPKDESAGERIGDSVPQGERHSALVTMAGSLRRVGLNTAEIESALLAIRDERFADGDHVVTDQEIEEVATWICSKPPDFMLTDLGNAERFAFLADKDVKFCGKWESWLVWDSRRWVVGDNTSLRRLAYQTIRNIYNEAAEQKEDEARRAIAKHAIRSESRSRIENMIHLAKAYLPVEPEDLDKYAMVLNVSNGIVDLKTGDLLPHSREYMMTKIIDIPYFHDAEAPKWNRFIELITGGDRELAYFLQLAVGYTLTGQTDEHCLFFLYGAGMNGKSTFTETIRRLMGDYARRTDIEALMASWTRGANATPHVADMVGARFVLASEIPENRKLNESLLKDLTGGDSITARHLFGNPFTFTPVHKLWIFGNHKPRVSGTDWGFWRRMRLIPFSVTIPDDVRRPMSDVLSDFEKEMPGILAWAVLGCIFWQNSGLESVPAVSDATSEYRTEQDIVQLFIDEKCELHPDYSIEKKNLYRVWREWCEDAGEEQARRKSKTWFTRQLTMRDLKSGGRGGGSIMGIRLKT